MPTATHRTLRLQGLLKADEMAIRVFLTQQGGRPSPDGEALWHLTDSKDASLCIRAAHHGVPLLRPRGEGPVVWLLDPDQTMPQGELPVLTSPVEREALLAVLTLVDHRLSLGLGGDDDDDLEDTLDLDDADDDGPAPEARTSAAPARPTFARTQVMSPREAERMAALMPRTPPPARFDTRGSVRLRQWPNNAFLTQHRLFPRWASFLLKRWLTVPELQQLSQVELADCIEFLNGAVAQGLLEIRLPDHLRSVAAPLASSAPSPAPPPQGELAWAAPRRAPPPAPVPTAVSPEPARAGPSASLGAPAPAETAQSGLLGRLSQWWRQRG